MSRTFGPLAACLLVFAGCNQSGEPTTAGRNGQYSVAHGNPDRTVFEFLEAVQKGNDQKAAEMLSPLARKKTAEMQMVVAPPGSATAKFKVGGVEYVTPEKDGAHVWSTWTDVVDDQGNTRTDDIVWVLRLESEGWRIVGMVTKVFPDQPPLVLNFEDPEDMLRKQQLLRGGADAPADGQANSGQPQATRSQIDQPAAR